MNDQDLEAQEDELVALASIFSQGEFRRAGLGGEIRVSLDLPQDFSVTIKPGDRNYVISFLPPVLLTFNLPCDYPSTSSPEFILSCNWLSHNQLSAVCRRLDEIWQDNVGSVVIFYWVKFLRYDVLHFLHLQSPLEIPVSDQGQTTPSTKDNAAGASQRVIEDNEAGASQRVSEDNEAGASQRVSEDNEAGASQRVSEDNEAGASQNVSEDNEAGASQRVSEDNEAGASQRVSEDNEAGASQNVSEDNEAGASQRASEDNEAGASQRVSEDNEAGASQNVSEDNEAGASQRVSEDNEAGASQRVSEDNEAGASQNVSEDNKAGASQRVSEDNEAGASQRVSEDNEAGASQRVSEDNEAGASQRVSEDNEAGASQRVSEDNEAGASQKVSEDNERGASQRVSEDNEAGASQRVSEAFNRVSEDRNAASEGTAVCLDHRAISELTRDTDLLPKLLDYNEREKQRVFDGQVHDCGICFMSKLGCSQFRECGHVYCNECMSEFFTIQITEGNVHGLICPEADCSSSATLSQVRQLVGVELFDRYDRLLLQSSLDRMADVMYCPRKTCAAPVILEPNHTAALCPSCRYAFCTLCQKTYHGNSECHLTDNSVKKPSSVYAYLPKTEAGLQSLWEDYESGNRARRRLLENRYGKHTMASVLQEGLSVTWKEKNSKNCPSCNVYIEKEGGCEKMICLTCGQYFCWLCLKVLDRRDPYSHFNTNHINN